MFQVPRWGSTRAAPGQDVGTVGKVAGVSLTPGKKVKNGKGKKKHVAQLPAAAEKVAGVDWNVTSMKAPAGVKRKLPLTVSDGSVAKKRRRKMRRKQAEVGTAPKSTEKTDPPNVKPNMTPNTAKGGIRRRKSNLNPGKLIQVLKAAETLQKKPKPEGLNEKMMDRLKGSRFRFLNERLYTSTSKEAVNLFQSNPDAFRMYHEGYRSQVSKWIVDPLDVIIQDVMKIPNSHVIADFGCGSARLARTVPNKCHSFDLVALNDYVTACDMSHTSLPDSSVDVAVFCLSLMGTNMADYIIEANRVLKNGGTMKIAEVESRFNGDVTSFMEGIERFGFKHLSVNGQKVFVFMDFKKTTTIRRKGRMPSLSLMPCLYKKR